MPYFILTAAALFAILFLAGSFRLSGQADDAGEDVMDRIAKRDRAFRTCGPGCCRGGEHGGGSRP